MSLSKATCFGSLLLILIISTSNFDLAFGGIIDDVRNEVNSAICPLKYLDDYKRCASVISPLYTIQSSLEGNEARARCCSSLATTNCVTMIACAKCDCGELTTEALDVVMRSVRGLVEGPACAVEVKSLTDCLDPIPVALLIAVVFIFVLAVIQCIWTVCYQAFWWGGKQ